MIGYISYRETQKKRGEVIPRMILGRRYLTAVVPGARRFTGEWEAGRLAGKMRRAGVKMAVFPREFPYEDVFLKVGILPVDTLSLYQAMAPQMVRYLMGEKHITPAESTVAIVAERLTPLLDEVVTELALKVRYLILKLTEDNGKELCERLRREYGISVIKAPTRRQLMAADALLLFAPQPVFQETNPITLYLYDGQRVLRHNGLTFTLPPKLRGEVEENCDEEQLLTLLLQDRTLESYQIPVKKVDNSEKKPYNAITV